MSDLKRHQKEGVARAKKHKKVLLAFEMGTGKTRTAIYAFKDEGAVVIAPSRILTDWGQELEKVGEPDYTIIRSKAEFDKIKSKWTILSYDILKTIDIAHKNIIVDESHYIKAGAKKSKKTGKPNRTKAVLDLVKNSEKTLLLTGTPITNRPIDLWNQLVAIEHTITDMGKTVFAKRYCGGHMRRVGGRFIFWAQGATEIDELKGLLGDKVMIVKMKDVVDLPPLTKIDRYIDMSATEQKEYNEVWQEYLDWLKVNIEEVVDDWDEKVSKLILDGRSKDLAEYIVEAEETQKRQRSRAIIKMIKTRKITSKIKAKAFLEMADEIQGQAIIFVEFNETKELLLKELKDSVGLDDVEKFKEGKVKFLVANIVAGGTGLNLQNAHQIFFIDMSWTPAINDQAVARIHRIGQENPMTVFNFVVKNTIDEVVLATNRSKKETIDKIME